MAKSSGILFFLVTLWMALSCGSREGTFIKGKIGHLDSTYILATYLSSDSLVIDTIPIDGKGRFICGQSRYPYRLLTLSRSI